MRVIIAIIVVSLIAGCSLRVFEKETAGFKDAATGVEIAWIGLYEKVDALRQAERDHVRIHQNWKLMASKECARLYELAFPPKAGLDEAAHKKALKNRHELIEVCTLDRHLADESEHGVFVDPVDRGLLPYAKVISDYAAALAALTAAEDEAAFHVAVAEARASFGKVSDALNQLGNADTHISGPISALATVFAEIYLAGIERRKYNTLRDVVEGADGPIQLMTDRLAMAEVLLRKRLLQAQYDAINRAENELVSCLSRAECAERQQMVIDRLLEYRAYARTLVPGGVSYHAVGEAHAQLLKAVRSPDDFQAAVLVAERLKSIGEAVKETVVALGLKDKETVR